MGIKIIDGGVCAAKGFKAGAVHSGMKKNPLKKDLALIVSDAMCNAAAVYTKNLVKAAPLYVTKDHLKDGKAKAVVVNAGNANACAPNDLLNASKEAEAAAKALGISTEDVVVASTGVIGQELNISLIEDNVDKIELSYTGSEDASYAIMTTDTKVKTIAAEFEIDGVACKIGGICKGSGMIHPNMGTMLCFVTTDCNISSEMLDRAIKDNVTKTFNRITVDGDTSTNDMCVVLANGFAENEEITEEGEAFNTFKEAYKFVMEDLAKKIAADGEGASRLITCTVKGAKDEATAETLSKSVCSSSLTKAAMFGSDANWGRVICAMGYSGAEFNTKDVVIEFASADGSVKVCEKGMGLDFDEDLAKKILTKDAIEINVTLFEGEAEVTCWGCDLTYDYIKINGDYRS